jgi:hypothetical protein
MSDDAARSVFNDLAAHAARRSLRAVDDAGELLGEDPSGPAMLHLLVLSGMAHGTILRIEAAVPGFSGLPYLTQVATVMAAVASSLTATMDTETLPPHELHEINAQVRAMGTRLCRMLADRL